MMGTKSYFFIILFLTHACFGNDTELATETAVVVERRPPKLNSKQNLLLNQIIGSYSLDGIQNPLCKNHTKKFKEALRFLKPWALQMFDSSSKLQAGLLVGNTGEFGSFKQCLDIYEPTEYGPIKGQMCTLQIIPGPNLTKHILRIRKLPTDSFEKISSTVKFNTLWSVCLPDSCPVPDVERHFNRTLLGISEGLDLEIIVDEDHCVSYAKVKPISDLQWIVITFMASLAAFVIICTIYDIVVTKYDKSEANEGLLIFSAYRNAKVIFSSKSGNLDCLNGIRSLSITWVILGHRYFHTMFVPIVNGLDVLDWTQTIPSTIVVGGTVSVDSFFMVSGLLVSYLFFSAMDKGVIFNLPLFYLHRYMRVTPPLAMMALFYATLIELFGSGPIWNSTIRGMKEPCVDYWWSCLLHVQNYFNPSLLCVVQTWYLTCDMQYYFFSPLVLYPMWKWPHFGIFLYLLALVMAVGINFELAWKFQFNGGMPVTYQLKSISNEVDEGKSFFQCFHDPDLFSIIFVNELLLTKYFTHHYTTPYTRASPYLIGIAAGYILYRTKDKKIKFNPAFSFLAWAISLGTFSAIVFGSLPFALLDHPYNRLESSIYLALSRPTWAIALAWVVFNCVHGTAGIINKILSSYVFSVIANLSYSMFLTHMFIMFAMGGAEKTQFYFTNLNMIYMFFGDYAFTLVLSFILSICVEIPINNIDTALRKKASKSRKISAKS